MHNNTLVSGVLSLQNVAAAEPPRTDHRQRSADSGEFRKALESERNSAERRKTLKEGEQRAEGEQPQAAVAMQGEAQQPAQSAAGGDVHPGQETALSIAAQHNEITAAQTSAPLSGLTPSDIDTDFARLPGGTDFDVDALLLADLPLHTQISLDTVGQAVSGIAMQWRSGNSGDTDRQLAANPVAELISMIANGDASLSPQSGSVLPQSHEVVAALLAKALALEGGMVSGQLPGSQNSIRQTLNRQSVERQAFDRHSFNGNVLAPDPGSLAVGILQGQLTDSGKDLPVMAGVTGQVGLTLPEDARSQARTQLNSLLQRSGQATTTLLDTDIETLQEAMAVATNSAATTNGLQEALNSIPSGAPRATAEVALPTVFSMPGQLRVALGQPQWQAAVAERVMTMAAQRLSFAEIQLDPPELGHLQVRVTLNQEQAHVSFVSHHAAVREALDQTAFRLRDMFEGEGLDLVDVDVSDQSFAGDRQQSEPGTDAGSGTGDDPVDSPAVATVMLSNQLVDQFV